MLHCPCDQISTVVIPILSGNVDRWPRIRRTTALHAYRNYTWYVPLSMFRDGIHDVTLSDHWGPSALLVLAVEMVNNNDYVDHRPNDCARTLIPFIICVVHFQCSENANNSAHYSTECTSSYLCVKYDDICEIGCPVPALLIRKKYSTHSQNTHWNHFKCKHLLSSLIPFFCYWKFICSKHA